MPSAFLHAQAMNLMTRTDLADRLGVAPKSINRLVDVGILPSPSRVGRTTLWTEEEVAPVIHARSAPSESDREPAILVKVAAAQPVAGEEFPPPRRHIGWNRNLAPLDADQIAGIDRWWSATEPERWIGDSFIVTSIGFVLAVYEILGVHTVQGLRHFELGPPTEAGKSYEGVRFQSERGAMLKAWD